MQGLAAAQHAAPRPGEERLRAEAPGTVDFLRQAGKLKATPRAGWVLKGLQGVESVADHSYRMALMTLLLDPAGAPQLDTGRCTQMALVHDLAEALVGDITPHDGVSKEEKQRRELEAMRHMCSTLPGQRGQHLLALFEEYEEGQTPEAQLVKDFDKVEMILQATEYEDGQGVTLNDFFASTQGKFRTEPGRAWAAEVVRQRQAGRTQG